MAFVLTGRRPGSCRKDKVHNYKTFLPYSLMHFFFKVSDDLLLLEKEKKNLIIVESPFLNAALLDDLHLIAVHDLRLSLSGRVFFLVRREKKWKRKENHHFLALTLLLRVDDSKRRQPAPAKGPNTIEHHLPFSRIILRGDGVTVNYLRSGAFSLSLCLFTFSRNSVFPPFHFFLGVPKIHLIFVSL